MVCHLKYGIENFSYCLTSVYIDMKLVILTLMFKKQTVVIRKNMIIMFKNKSIGKGEKCYQIGKKHSSY